MAERKTIVYPNPEVLAQAVAARTLLTIIDLLAEPDRQRGHCRDRRHRWHLRA